jgi:hypothetical protein
VYLNKIRPKTRFSLSPVSDFLYIVFHRIYDSLNELSLLPKAFLPSCFLGSVT